MKSLIQNTKVVTRQPCLRILEAERGRLSPRCPRHCEPALGSLGSHPVPALTGKEALVRPEAAVTTPGREGMEKCEEYSSGGRILP